MNKENKKKFNWGALTIIIVIVAIIGLMGWWLFGRKVKTLTEDQFIARINIDKTDQVDNKNYINKVTYTKSTNSLYVDEFDNGNETSYQVGVDQGFVNAYMFKYLPDGKTISKLHQDLVAATNAPKPKRGQDPNGGIYMAPTPKASFWPSLLISFLPIIIIVGVIIWIARKSSGGAGSPFNAGKNKAIKIISDKKFSDVAGNEEVKEEVKELVDFLKKGDKYTAIGATIPKGILLEGPPGTGKTLIAKATAGEANVPFFFISGSSFVEMFIGLGAARVRSMFKEARKSAPCIIFIDELDAVGRSRGTGLGGGNDEREQTLNQLLVEMDGMEESTGVLIIAATNRADVLDPALLRPGRFDRTIKVVNPDIKERELILKLHSKGKRIDPSVKFNLVAKRTPGFSGAQLASVINEAALMAVRENRKIINIVDIDEGIDRVIAGPARKSRTITQEELKMIAYHEAGHAVLGLKVPGGQIVQKITIIPRGNAGGYNLMTPEKESFNYKKSELIAKIISFMGGRAAEQLIYGKGEVSTGASDDISKATNIARTMVTQWGMSDLGPIQYESSDSLYLGRDINKNKNFSDQVGYKIDQEVRKIIDSAEQKALVILKKYSKLHKAIADALLKKETIVAEEIKYIEKHLKLPPAIKTVTQKTTAKGDDLKTLISSVKTKKKVKAKKSKVKSVIKKKTKVKTPKVKSVIKKTTTKK